MCNKKKEGDWIGHFLHGNYLVIHVIEVKAEGKKEMTERREKRYKQLLNDLKYKRGYWRMKRKYYIALCGKLVSEEAMELT
jgi:hypothetical protein